MTDFDLHQLIRANLADATSPDPHDVAAAVLSGIPKAHSRTVLAQLIPDAVREEIRRQRSSMRPGVGGCGKRDLGALTSDPNRMGRHVPGVGWKFEADLTADDCDAIADDYFMRALANESEGKRWRSTADRMRQHGAVLLADLGAVKS